MRSGYGIVVRLVVLSLIVRASAPDGDFTRLVVIWLQGATLVLAVPDRGRRPPTAQIAAAVALLIGIAAPVLWLVHGSIPDGVTGIATGLFAGVAPAVIAGLVRDMRAACEVSDEALAGVLSIYLLAGMFFAFAFSAVGAIGDERLFEQVANPGRATTSPSASRRSRRPASATSLRPPSSAARCPVA